MITDKPHYEARAVSDNTCFVEWYKQKTKTLWPQHLIYADPPYLLSARSSGRTYYTHEWTEQQHVDFLETMLKSKDLVIISHYRCELYDNLLSKWRVKSWPVMTHTGTRLESIYINYPAPTELHQYDFLGNDFTDRQRIKRRKQNLVAAMQQMSAAEKLAAVHELQMLLRFALNECNQK